MPAGLLVKSDSVAECSIRDDCAGTGLRAQVEESTHRQEATANSAP